MLKSRPRWAPRWKTEIPTTEITGVAGIEEAAAGQITFVANPKYAAAAKTTAASAVIVSEDFPAISTGMLRSKNPYLAFARAIDLFYQAAAVRCRACIRLR